MNTYKEVLQALADGKRLQGLTDGSWEDMDLRDVCYRIYLNHRPGNFRVKPELTIINGIECEGQLKEMPGVNDKIYLADPTILEWAEKVYGGDKYRIAKYLQRGLLYNTEENAIRASKAMANWEDEE